MKKISSIITILLLLITISFTQNYIEKVGTGEIDWTKGVIKVTGIGVPPAEVKIEAQARPMALKAAKNDAYRNFLEIVNGVRVTGETIVKNFVVESDIIRTQVDGLVKGAQQIDIRYLSDGTVEVDLAIPLYGRESLSQIILPKVVEKEKVTSEIIEKLSRRLKNLEQLIKELETRIEELEIKIEKKKSKLNIEIGKEEGRGKYTGLIIDATGLGLKPALSPKVLNEDYEEVYGSMSISPDEAIERGIVGYTKSIEEAKKLKNRIGDNPLIIKAVDTEGALKANPIISNESAELIKNNIPKEVLEKCSVVIVL